MAFPFQVGQGIIQDALDWVAQPPPRLAGDTHALRFRLHNIPDMERNPQYSGLLFFRPEGVGTSFVGRRPGLDGFGSLLVTDHSCQALLGPTSTVQPAELVRVFLAFRQEQSGPAEVFATLTFMDGDLLQLPTQTTGSVPEFSNVVLPRVEEGFRPSHIDMDPPQGWRLLLQKTTVLLSRV